MANIYTDNFDSYNDGDLHGQGSWSGVTDFDIQGTVKQAGTKAVSIASAAGGVPAIITKIGTQRADGTNGIYIRKSKNNDGEAHFEIYEGTTFIAEIYLKQNGNIYYYGTGADISLGTYSADTWYYLQIQWRSTPDHKVRFKLDSGSWSDWIAPANDWTTGPDRIKIWSRYQDTGDVDYYDTIDEPVIETNVILNGTVSISNGGRINPTLTRTINGGVIKIVSGGRINPTLTKTINGGIIKVVSGILNILITGWNTKIKHSSTWTNKTKNLSTFTNKPKNNSNWINKTKH